ncbi:MAG: DUF5658 family protein [Desulfobacterales bacterium]|jgi:hypothetical protein
MQINFSKSRIIDKRSGKDRRTKSSLTIKTLFCGGKREQIRRQADTKRVFYVDRYSPGLFFAIVSILFLCVIDALLTLRLWSHGAYEVNPVMAYFLGFGPYTFFISKYLLAIIPAIFLLMFRNIALRSIRTSTRSVLYLMATFYLVVVVMELYFVSNLAYSPEMEVPPKILTDTRIVCQLDNLNTIN